ncbi:HAUS augmin-like complex subunit 2 [Stegastes partitus]|uniref:HAUS augmin-like complex subunit 2 n=1 Tax=Stegastes partitus TaxID=144197 RepID=A0A3B4Z2Z9_9TELE|nr:PREDICTED: HAUS augmin-like complex subunit 2 [Stegastes partitus]XP_008294895.1 PREDICTED: HAUS augmin-like complex subunit 2 [Stegastes partitus]
MHRWDVSPFSVTPAASLLSRCVSIGAVSQEEIDSASSSQSPTFSSQVQQVEQRITMQKQLDELQLQLELLKVDKQSADVAHSFHLAQRFQLLQMLASHLQDILKEQKSLRQRLMKPLARTNLPVPAHLHRFVVNSVKLMMDFIETLEEKLSSAHSWTSTRERLMLLDSSLALLLAQAAEMETLSNQILQWKTVGSSQLSDLSPSSSSSS